MMGGLSDGQRDNQSRKPFFAAVAIAENTDMNDLTTPGVYFSGASWITNTLRNYPLSGSGFTLLVLYQSTNVRQVAFHAQHILTRGSTSAGWGSWYKITAELA